MGRESEEDRADDSLPDERFAPAQAPPQEQHGGCYQRRAYEGGGNVQSESKGNQPGKLLMAPRGMMRHPVSDDDFPSLERCDNRGRLCSAEHQSELPEALDPQRS